MSSNFLCIFCEIFFKGSKCRKTFHLSLYTSSVSSADSFSSRRSLWGPRKALLLGEEEQPPLKRTLLRQCESIGELRRAQGEGFTYGCTWSKALSICRLFVSVLREFLLPLFHPGKGTIFCPRSLWLLVCELL